MFVAFSVHVRKNEAQDLRLYTHIHTLALNTYLCSFKSSSNCEIFVTIFRCSFRIEFNSFRILACSFSFFDDSPAILRFLWFCSYLKNISFYSCVWLDQIMHRKNNNDNGNNKNINLRKVKWNTQRETERKFSNQNGDRECFHYYM